MNVDEPEIIDEREGKPRYLPDRETIRRVCLEIQSGWTPEEERRRRAWSIPAEMHYGGAVRVNLE